MANFTILSDKPFEDYISFVTETLQILSSKKVRGLAIVALLEEPDEDGADALTGYYNMPLQDKQTAGIQHPGRCDGWDHSRQYEEIPGGTGAGGRRAVKDRENLMDTEIKLLQEAGRRYGLMLDRLRREKRDRTRMEARRAIETAMRKHGPSVPCSGGQGQGDLLR